MTDWQAYWNGAGRVTGKSHLEQVGKTVNGKPISEEHIEAIVRDIVEALSMDASDRVLDLCCGNGLLTYRCARFCDSLVAVDFSGPLIAVAAAAFASPNIRYVQADVSMLPDDVLRQPFSKIYIYEGLQHLSYAQAELLLQTIQRSASRGATIFLGSVPDKDRLWNFYDTPARREDYARRMADGTEAIGHWWTADELECLMQSCGYTGEFRSPHPALHGAHYRFDLVCRPS
jgi:cyclopropane fatty-acyl-phospholipid synthase-like methyltransferase